MELFFSNTYDKSNLILLEIPEYVYEDYIVKNEGQLIIKGTEPTVICTNDKSYELKFLETSNTYMILDSEKESDTKQEIVSLAYHTLVCDELSPKKYQVYNFIKKHTALAFALSTGESNYHSLMVKYSREECFTMSDLPRKKYDDFLSEHLIFDKEGFLCIFDDAFVNNIVFYILKAIALVNKDEFASLDEIYEELLKTTNDYDKVINNILTEEKHILLMYIFDYNQEPKQYTLSLKKSLLFISKIVFFSNNNSAGQFTVSSYISLLQMCLKISLPFQTLNALVEDSETYLLTSSCQDNLFEFYKEYDFRYLIGHCVLYFIKGSKELLIKWIDVPSLAEKFEERINELFQLKEKWTQKEMNLFMSDLELSNLHERVSRVTQMVTEVNPFNNDKQISYLYIKRNPFFKK